MKIKWTALIALIVLPLSSMAGEGFNSMMDSFDSGSFQGRESFRQNVIRILNTEELDPAEFRMVHAALTQVNRAEPSFLHRRIENEIARLEKIFESPPQARSAQWIRFCKRRFSAGSVPLITTDTLKIPVFIESENPQIVKTNTRDLPFIKWPAPAAAKPEPVRSAPESSRYNRDWPLK